MRKKKLVNKSKTFSIWKDETSGYEFVQIGVTKRSVMAIPIDKSGQIYMIKKYFPALGITGLVFPGGKVEVGESDENAIKRELLEEVGLVGNYFEKMLTLAILPGYLVGETAVYKVSDVEKAAEFLDKEETLEVVLMSKVEVLKCIENGKIIDARSVAAALRTISSI
jgi:8-oxo-dGTP pyrophosphatase MutT (NUDIX family)